MHICVRAEELRKKKMSVRVHIREEEGYERVNGVRARIQLKDNLSCPGSRWHRTDFSLLIYRQYIKLA